jgi:glucose-6-phosphate isomerase
LYERAVGLYASLVNVNAYHQPGVEAGKKAAASILDLQTRVVAVLQKEKTPISLDELAKKAGASDQVEAIYKILRHIHANQRGVVLQGDLQKPGSLTVSAS